MLLNQMFSICSMLPKEMNIACPKKEKVKTVDELLSSKKSKDENEKIVSSVTKLDKTQYIAESNIYDDLEVFSGNANKDESIFNVVNKTQTLFGNIFIKNMLETPTKDVDVLKNRQNILNKFTPELIKKIDEKLLILKELEEDVLWILREKNPEELKIIDSVYFTNKYLTMLNSNEDILSLYSMFTIFFAPLYGILSPLIFFVLPYLYLYFFAGIKFSLKAYFEIFKVSILGGFNIMSSSKNSNLTKYFSVVLSIIIYFQNFMNTIKVANNNYNIINILHSKLNKLHTFMAESSELLKITKDLFKRDDISNIDTKLNNNLFKSDPTLLSNKGKILVCYKEIEKIDIDKYKLYFTHVGEIDSYLSIVKLVNDFKDKNYNICYTRYDNSVTPILNFKDLWHPYLSKNSSKQIVSNSIDIGGKNPNNIILTGPNAGGKSTFIKAISLSLLFSQTLGISFSKEAKISPMSLINTYLNIPDCKNKESLFEAEMHRSRDYLNKLKELGEKDFAFIVMDEIFSSTNPEEGISGAYAICNRLSEYKNSVALITTHFSYLTKLEDNKKFKNYKIPIVRNDVNEIEYPYKLEIGASTQHIALELLKKKGFDDELVDNAISICNTLKIENLEKQKETVNESTDNDPNNNESHESVGENENDNDPNNNEAPESVGENENDNDPNNNESHESVGENENDNDPNNNEAPESVGENENDNDPNETVKE